MEKIKIAFLGTPEFSVPTLEALAKDPNFEISLVITQPDQPVGRRQIMTAPAVKQAALTLNLKVAQPKSKKELKEILEHYGLDFLVVIAYGMILSEAILATPKHEAINIHASILPQYRGASPIHHSLLNGDNQSGISIMKMNQGMDTGEIYGIEKIKIEEEDDIESLNDKLANLSAEKTAEYLIKISKDQIKPLPQEEEQASYCHKISKKDGEINFQEKTAQEVLNMYRAFKNWPGIYTYFEGKKLEIVELQVSNIDLKAGELIIKDQKLLIGCKENSIEIEKLKIEGKQAMDAQNFINGYRQKLKH